MQIGIPRAVGYYNYYAFWHGFFSFLGIKPVLSSPTNKETISKGASLVISDTCLPIKVYLGHVLDLIENKGIENIYVPSIQSIDYKIYNCAKIRGLPDLVRNVVNKKFNLIEPTLDMSDENQGFYQYLKESVEPFGITDEALIKQASKKGWEVQNSFNMMLKSGINFEKALKSAINGKVVLHSQKEEKPIKIAVVSHYYNIYDSRISMRIFDKLENFGAKVLTSMNLSDEQMKEGLNKLNTNLYWANELEMSGAAGHYLHDSSIDGIITVNSFGCGPDSIMIERMTKSAKEMKKPLLTLTIDEHTGEAGFITRLEAFCDMLFRQKRIALSKALEPQVEIETTPRKEEEKIKVLSA